MERPAASSVPHKASSNRTLATTATSASHNAAARVDVMVRSRSLPSESAGIVMSPPLPLEITPPRWRLPPARNTASGTAARCAKKSPRVRRASNDASYGDTGRQRRRRGRVTARTAGMALVASTAFLVAGCGGHNTATLAPAKTTSAPPATTSPVPNLNAKVCRDFETVAGRISLVLAAARTRPASMTAGNRHELLQAARLMDRWSNTTVPVASGSQFGTLPLDLRGASIAAHNLATGYRNPSAASYVRGTASAVGRVVTDCAAITGNQGG
jgi:hypothetical protein